MYREMFRIASLHKIRPLIEVMPLAKVNDAVKKLQQGHARYRLVLSWTLLPIMQDRCLKKCLILESGLSLSLFYHIYIAWTQPIGSEDFLNPE